MGVRIYSGALVCVWWNVFIQPLAGPSVSKGMPFAMIPRRLVGFAATMVEFEGMLVVEHGSSIWMLGTLERSVFIACHMYLV